MFLTTSNFEYLYNETKEYFIFILDDWDGLFDNQLFNGR